MDAIRHFKGNASFEELFVALLDDYIEKAIEKLDNEEEANTATACRETKG
jgi:hypothetical protein